MAGEDNPAHKRCDSGRRGDRRAAGFAQAVYNAGRSGAPAMTITFANPRAVHPPVGPYSHTAVVRAGTELVFVSGQVGMRADGSTPAGFAEQCELTFENLRRCLAAHGLDLDAVVKLTAFVVPGQDFQLLRAARERHFGVHRPTSTTVYVPALASPAFLVEIEAIAAKSAASSQ
jgi:2-iminobutanoate/2-iminopropanoate deaminase